MKNLRYLIDKNDIILEVNQEWNDFVKANQIEDIDATKIVGQSLWKYISHTGVLLLYEMVLKRARETQKKIILPFRCDSPSLRRFMQIEITPLQNDEIAFETQLLRSQSRAAILFSEYNEKSNAPLLHICSWCNHFKVSENEWVEIEEGIKKFNLFSLDPLPMITHDLCKFCFEKVINKINFLEKNSF